MLYRLSYRALMAVQTGFEPAISSVTGRHDKPLHYWTLVAEGRFELPTFGLWAQRATRLLYSAITNGGDGGIRTPAQLSPPLGFQDQPLQPDLGTSPKFSPLILIYLVIYILYLYMVVLAGLEPATNRLWAGGSNQLS